MSEDPFYIVKEELQKSIVKIDALFERYNRINQTKTSLSINEAQKTCAKLKSEIKTCLTSVNWDIQDLEETINIVEKNLDKFKLTPSEIRDRRNYITISKAFVAKTQKSLEEIERNEKNTEKNDDFSVNIKIPDNVDKNSKNNYIRLNDFNSDDEINNESQSGMLKQETLIREQDEQLDMISGRVTNLKYISQTMQNEIDSQAILLNELDTEMEKADTRMQTVMKKLQKVLHLSNDQRQWTAIGILLGIIFILIILFGVL